MLTSGDPGPVARKLPLKEAAIRSDASLALVLISGGLDSTTLLHVAKAQGLAVRALQSAPPGWPRSPAGS
jgi:PP-loop superfamily ATP-utilizing enzyme